MSLTGPDPKERETERPSKIFGEINNLQVIDFSNTTYKKYNVATGRCRRCKLGALRQETGECGAEDSVTYECFTKI